MIGIHRRLAAVFLRRALALTATLLAPHATLGAQMLIQAPEVVGAVVDPDGRPLPNAQVFIESLNRGTLTDADGRYHLRAIPPGRYHVDVQLIGFRRAHKEVVVTAESVPVTVDFVLVPTPLQLADVVATA